VNRHGGAIAFAFVLGIFASAGLASAIASYDPRHRDRCLLLAAMPPPGSWRRETDDGMAELSALASKVTVHDRLFPYQSTQSKFRPPCGAIGGLREDGFEGMRWSPDGSHAIVFDGFAVPDALIGQGRGCLFRRYSREDWHIVGCFVTWIA
jgi:hypothetical protein